MIYRIPKRKNLRRQTAVNRPSVATAQSAFTLIEVVIVIALIAFVYGIGIPQLNMKTGVETSTKLGRLLSDIRSAFDLAVLSGKNYRLVFSMAEGQYWLETTDSENFYLGDALLDRDPNEEEEKGLQSAFLDEFSNYEELMEAEITNPNDDTKIASTSPLIKAKERLAPAEWRVVNDLEWSIRDLGSFLIFQSIQTEHHGSKQEMSSLGKEGRVHLYFFPRGYVERAMIHVAFRKDDEEIDTEQKPYTVLTNPYEGTADVKPGYEEIDVRGDG